MVKRVVRAMFGQVANLNEAAFWLALFALFSQFLALVRDRLLTHNFGAGPELDIYYAAFKIPDLLFVTVASIVSISALVPLFAKKETEGERHLNEATSSIFSVFSISIILFCVLAWVLMPQIIPLFFASLPLLALEKIIFLSRILLLSPLLLGFSNFFGSIVQYEKRFILYSISPLLYNIGIIIGIIFGIEKYGALAAVAGVVLGAFLHLFLQAAFVFSSEMRPHFTLNIKWKDVLETAYLSFPRTLALSITTFVAFFFTALASGLEEGSISIFNLSFNLQSVPLSLIGVSFSLAAFPSIAVSAAKKSSLEIIDKIGDGLRKIIFWSLPLTALFIILRAHIVRVIFGSGDFNWSDTRLTAAVFAIFVISSVFQSISLFLSRSHYALGKTKWPLLGNIVGGVFSVMLCLFFINYAEFLEGFINYIANILNISYLPKTILFLPISYSLGSFLTSLILYIALGSTLSKEIWQKMKNLFLPIISAALFVALGSYYFLHTTNNFFNLDTFFGVLIHGALAGLFGIALGAIVLYSFGNKEFEEVLSKFKQ